MEALTAAELDIIESDWIESKSPDWLDDVSFARLLAMARSSLADREDAQRYRWLRSLDTNALVYIIKPADKPQHPAAGTDAFGSDLDEQIDAARTQPPKD